MAVMAIPDTAIIRSSHYCYYSYYYMAISSHVVSFSCLIFEERAGE